MKTLGKFKSHYIIYSRGHQLISTEVHFETCQTLRSSKHLKSLVLQINKYMFLDIHSN